MFTRNNSHPPTSVVQALELFVSAKLFVLKIHRATLEEADKISRTVDCSLLREARVLQQLMFPHRGGHKIGERCLAQSPIPVGHGSVP